MKRNVLYYISSFKFGFNVNKLKATSYIKKDLKKFGLIEDYDISELKNKFLAYTKMYHPDIRQSDPEATKDFQEIRESFERLKIFYELKTNKIKLEDYNYKQNVYIIDNIIENNSNYYNTDKKEFIRILLLEDEYGVVKNKSIFVNNLFYFWFIIGSLVLYKDLTKYFNKLKQNLIT